MPGELALTLSPCGSSCCASSGTLSFPTANGQQAAAEVVGELLNEGLRAALLDEVHGRHFFQPPRLGGVGTVERTDLVAW
ncbi:hypothetical protein PRNP1_010154 [Phytophthora ramorum]